MKSIYNFRMIPDDGSRLKVIENGVLREERELWYWRETLHCYFYKIIYNITKYLLILLLLGNPSVLILLLSLPSTHQIYISFFFVFLFFNSYTSFILYIYCNILIQVQTHIHIHVNTSFTIFYTYNCLSTLHLRCT